MLKFGKRKGENMENCGSCRYMNKMGGLTFCHRYPPVHINNRPTNYGVIPEYANPQVSATDWCGEWHVKIETHSWHWRDE